MPKIAAGNIGLLGQWIRKRDGTTLEESLAIFLCAANISKTLRCTRAKQSPRQINYPSSSKDSIVLAGEAIEVTQDEEARNGEEMPTLGIQHTRRSLYFPRSNANTGLNVWRSNAGAMVMDPC